jgi:MoxR-like ATPase
MMLTTINDVNQAFAREAYIADSSLSTSVFLALRMGKALLLEGEPGVGKTEIAKVLSRIFDTRLIRLQCYEGIDISQAVYEWNYPRQLIEIQTRQHASTNHSTGYSSSHSTHNSTEYSATLTDNLYTEAFLLKRPLLQAIDHAHTHAPVLLIDELDRADEEFESFLLELLSDFQITIPEMGTLTAKHRPIVIITSNRTRELHDALKRRCVYCWIDYPSPEKELEIVQRKLPAIAPGLASQIVSFIQAVRKQDLAKLPGVAETLDWAEALQHLGTVTLSRDVIQATLGMILKYQDDLNSLRGQLMDTILEEIPETGR